METVPRLARRDTHEGGVGIIGVQLREPRAVLSIAGSEDGSDQIADPSRRLNCRGRLARLAERRFAHLRAGQPVRDPVSVDAMSLPYSVERGSVGEPSAALGRVRLRLGCSSSCSTHPLQWLKSVIGSARNRPGFDLLQYSQHARPVEGLVTRLGRGGSSPLQRTFETRMVMRVSSFKRPAPRCGIGVRCSSSCGSLSVGEEWAAAVAGLGWVILCQTKERSPGPLGERRRPPDIGRMHTSSPDPTPDQSATQTLLTASQLARRFSVSQGWVYQAVADGRLPHIRLGRADGPVRFVGAVDETGGPRGVVEPIPRCPGHPTKQLRSIPDDGLPGTPRVPR